MPCNEFFIRISDCVSGMVATSIAVLSIAILNEAIKRIRIHLMEETISTRIPCTNEAIEDTREVNEAVDEATPLVSQSYNRYNMQKILDVLLYGVQTIVNYLLMLVAMSYSTWLFLAVIIGMTAGNMIFITPKMLELQNSAFHPEANRTSALRSYGTMSNQPTNWEPQVTSSDEEDETTESIIPQTDSVHNVITVDVHC